MPTKVNRENLVHALELVAPGLSSREVVSQSNSFIFKDKKIISFNDETACSIPSPLDITGAVPSEPLRSILQKLKEDHLEVEQKDGFLLFKGRNQSSGILMETKIELPIENLEFPKKWKPLTEKFSEGLKLIFNCAGKDDAQFTLTCIHLHPDYMEAFDGNQFARVTLSIGIKKETLIRQISIKNIINLEMNEYAETPQWFHFRNSTGLVMSCRRYADKYHDLQKIASVTGEKIQLPKGLSEMSERAEVFSSLSAQDNDDIRIDLRPGIVRVKGEGQYGWYSGSRKVRYKGQSLSFLVHPAMLAQIVKEHSECQICTGTILALKAELPNFIFVTSLSSPQEKDEKKKVPKKTTKKKKVQA